MKLDDPPERYVASDVHKDSVFSFLVSALDSIAIGVIAVDQSLRPVHTNRYAREILDQGASLVLNNGTLTCPQPGDATRLRLAVVRCISGETRAPIVFRLYDHRRTEHVEVAIKRCSDTVPDIASIYVHSPGLQSGAPEILLAELYGLTRAERQIAALLTREGSVTVAAKVRGVSPSTARTHLRSLLRKTGARRQVDLVQRLSTGVCGLVRFCMKNREQGP